MVGSATVVRERQQGSGREGEKEGANLEISNKIGLWKNPWKSMEIHEIHEIHEINMEIPLLSF